MCAGVYRPLNCPCRAITGGNAKRERGAEAPVLRSGGGRLCVTFPGLDRLGGHPQERRRQFRSVIGGCGGGGSGGYRWRLWGSVPLRDTLWPPFLTSPQWRRAPLGWFTNAAPVLLCSSQIVVEAIRASHADVSATAMSLVTSEFLAGSRSFSLFDYRCKDPNSIATAFSAGIL